MPPAGARTRSNAFQPGAPVARDWWALFQSPALDQTRSSWRSPEARRSTPRGRRSPQAQAGGHRGDAALYYPQLDLGAGASRSAEAVRAAQAAASDHECLQHRARRELQPGCVRRHAALRRAADRRSPSAKRYQLAAAYLTLTGNAVSQAINIAADRAQFKAAEEILAADQRDLDLVRDRMEAGKAAQTRRSERADPALATIRRCCRRCGSSSARLDTRSPFWWESRRPSGRPPISIDRTFAFRAISRPLASALVRERPDILAAEAQLHAASAAIGVAEAQLYPTSRFGLLRFSSRRAWAPVRWRQRPLESDLRALPRRSFMAATSRRNDKRPSTPSRPSLATYRQTFLQAFGQVADVLRGLEHDAELLAAEQSALDTAQQSLSLRGTAYTAGQASLLQVLDAQRALRASRTRLRQGEGPALSRYRTAFRGHGRRLAGLERSGDAGWRQPP